MYVAEPVSGGEAVRGGAAVCREGSVRGEHEEGIHEGRVRPQHGGHEHVQVRGGQGQRGQGQRQWVCMYVCVCVRMYLCVCVCI